MNWFIIKDIILKQKKRCLMNKKVFLFLDDDAFHPDKIRDPEIYYPLIGAEKILEKLKSNNYQLTKMTTVEDSKEFIEKYGCPNFISFDNDLQRELEGIHLAQWIVEKSLDDEKFMPVDFDFFVHSQNIVAKERINGLLNNYLNHKKQQQHIKEEKLHPIKSENKKIKFK